MSASEASRQFLILLPLGSASGACSRAPTNGIKRTWPIEVQARSKWGSRSGPLAHQTQGGSGLYHAPHGGLVPLGVSAAPGEGPAGPRRGPQNS